MWRLNSGALVGQGGVELGVGGQGDHGLMRGRILASKSVAVLSVDDVRGLNFLLGHLDFAYCGC